MHWLLRGVQFPHVQPQISLPSARGGTEVALEHGLVPGMDQAVGLQGVALGEPGVTDVALVGLLARVDAEVPLKLERVRTCISAVRALIGPFTRVTTHVTL